MSDLLLYRWPPAAKFGRVIPKTKFYEQGTVSSKVRQKFVAEVQRITWEFKLADETVHLRGDETVPEIQVFGVDAKEDDVSDDVLAAIDKAVVSPIIFEITRARERDVETRMVACHKQPGGTRPKLSAYFSTKWVPGDRERSPLPPALDLPSLHRGLLIPILPVSLRSGESLAESTERVGQARKLEREITKIERRIENEPQFNRKVALRRELKTQAAALAALFDSVPSGEHQNFEKDPKWTN